MKIILLKDLEKVGKGGDVVKVSDGYARNYLLPKKYAIVATSAALKKIESIKKNIEMEKLEAENKLKAIAAKIKEISLTFTRKADENGHLYGSVSEIDITNAIIEKNIEIHKSNVVMEKHLKELGEHTVKIHLAPGIDSDIKINVIPE